MGSFLCRWRVFLSILLLLLLRASAAGGEPYPESYAQYGEAALPEFVKVLQQSVDLKREELKAGRKDEREPTWDVWRHCRHLCARLAELDWNTPPDEAARKQILQIAGDLLKEDLEFEGSLEKDTSLLRRHDYPYLSVKLLPFLFRAMPEAAVDHLPGWREETLKKPDSVCGAMWRGAVFAFTLKLSEPLLAKQEGMLERLRTATAKAVEKAEGKRERKRLQTTVAELEAARLRSRLIPLKDDLPATWKLILGQFEDAPLAPLATLPPDDRLLAGTSAVWKRRCRLRGLAGHGKRQG